MPALIAPVSKNIVLFYLKTPTKRHEQMIVSICRYSPLYNIMVPAHHRAALAELSSCLGYALKQRH